MYRVRRRRLLLGVVLVLPLAHRASQLLSDTGHVPRPTARTRNDPRRVSVPAVRWPLQGQGSDTSVLVAAAGQVTEQLVGSVAPTVPGARP